MIHSEGDGRPEPASLDLTVFRDLFVALTEEMSATLQRTAHSPNVVERRDHSCALYSAAGRAIALGDHMPVHLGSMSLSVAAVRGALELGPGDVAIVNAPYAGGTHLPDLTLVQGVWLDPDGEPAWWLATRAHHADVGGRSAGSMPLADDLYEEGVVLPPVRLLAGGEPVEATWRHLLANVRTPREREGDLAAQLAALATGERRLRSLVERYGRRRLDDMGDELLGYTARLVGALLDVMPDGRWVFADRLDGDGFAAGAIPIRVAIDVTGPTARFDFSGTAPAVRGPVNANPAIVRSAVFYVLRALLEEDAPANDGVLDPVEIVIPTGSILDPGPSRPVAGGNVETSQRLVDVLLGALAGALPERIPAASQGTMNNLTLGGRTEAGEAFAYYETIAGGAGAHPRGPGASAIHTHMTNSLNTPIEALERTLPVRVVRYAVRRGSGGSGRHCGGDGVVRSFEALAPLEGTLLADRRSRGPWGLAEGGSGSPGAARIESPDGAVRALPGKVTFRLEPGDRLVIETPGGGGWGSSSRVDLRSSSGGGYARPVPRGTFREIDHTADLGLDLEGSTPESVLEAAARGLVHALFGGHPSVEPEESRTVRVEADGWPELLKAWCERLYRALEEDRFVTLEAAVSRLSGTSLEATLHGAVLDPDQIAAASELKAVTWHQLAFEHDSGGNWHARVIFDV